jgi:hypothetical protein
MTPKLHRSIISLAFALLAFNALAQTPPRATGGFAERFEQLDRDGDGKVSREEGGSLPFFDEADKNRDAFLTERFAEALHRAGARARVIGAPERTHGQIALEFAQPGDKVAEAVFAFFERGRPSAVTPATGQFHDSILAPKSPARTSVAFGNAKPAPQDNIRPPLNLRFTQDYFSGRRDVNGQWMGGTEALNLAVHKGRLYAGIGYWQDIPHFKDKPGDPWVGAQILVKEGKDAPWKVDLNMGQRILRARALCTVTFETDAHGNRLPQPVEMLLTSGMNFGSIELLVWSRDDEANQWHRMVVDRIEVGDYLVAIGSHRDQVTGVSYVFGGSRNGSVYKGMYDPAAPGTIRWENKPEFTTRDERDDTKNAERRVMGFAEADGVLYASIRTSIYRRVAGGKPDWKEVYHWPLPPPDEEGWRRPQGRGLTAVPKPDGKGRMLLVALEMEQVIRRIDPAKGHRVKDDFDVGAYFLNAWGHEVRSSLCMAHNRMVPYTIPSTGEKVLMFGFGANPRGAPSWNRSGGAGLFIRRADGAYQHVPVEDPSLDPHPLLYATRDIAPSPWEPNVIYACGYDATGNAALKTRAFNTAWIYRSEFQQNKPRD